MTLERFLLANKENYRGVCPVAFDVFFELSAKSFTDFVSEHEVPPDVFGDTRFRRLKYSRGLATGDVFAAHYVISTNLNERFFFVFAEDLADQLTFWALTARPRYPATGMPLCRLLDASEGRYLNEPDAPSAMEAKLMLADVNLAFAYKGGSGISVKDFRRAYNELVDRLTARSRDSDRLYYHITGVGTPSSSKRAEP